MSDPRKRDIIAAYRMVHPGERLKEAAQAVVGARVGLVDGFRSPPLDDAIDALEAALRGN